MKQMTTPKVIIDMATVKCIKLNSKVFTPYQINKINSWKDYTYYKKS